MISIDIGYRGKEEREMNKVQNIYTCTYICMYMYILYLCCVAEATMQLSLQYTLHMLRAHIYYSTLEGNVEHSIMYMYVQVDH